MKKLALVLGSLLVVGSVASAKEMVPAPAANKEVVVRVVEKPVVVYRDREVEEKWRPNGYVSVNFKTYGEIESTKTTDNRGWEGADPESRLELKGKVALTPKQALEIRTRDWRGLSHRNNEEIDRDDAYVKHTYDFGKIHDKIGMSLESKYDYSDKNDQSIKEKLAFDFADYFFQNDYIKTTGAVIAPNVAYNWDKSWHDEDYGIYMDYTADLMYGMTFEAEFDNFYNYNEPKEGKSTQKGAVELILDKPFDLYANGKHAVGANLELDYTTSWLWHKNSDQKKAGVKTWSSYEAKFEPTVTYTYAATDYVKLHATLGAEYVNRNDEQGSANHWRWQPYTELGMKVVF